MYDITVKKKALKNIRKLPKDIQIRFAVLLENLKKSGPIQNTWPNYSKLGDNKYHCHLNYHYVACWTYENNTVKVEVYYVGSRENAPY